MTSVLEVLEVLYPPLRRVNNSCVLTGDGVTWFAVHHHLCVCDDDDTDMDGTLRSL